MEFARPIDADINQPQPTFFDLLAQSDFEKLLPPLVEPLLPQSKRKLIYYTVKAMVDLVMLKGFGGIASEVVYGLERRHSRRPWMVYIVTLMECHIIPLISQTTNLLPSLPKPLKKILQILNVLVKLAYITSDCKSFSLPHYVTGITYHHSSTDIYERTDLLGRIIKTVLITGQLGIFLIQSGLFDKLESNQLQSITIPTTAPDIEKLTPKPHPDGYPAPQRAGICPICLESWRNPVALSSGYIYCQKCIKNDWKTCPVTLVPISRIVPLFLN